MMAKLTKILVHQNESKMLYASSKTIETQNCMAKVSIISRHKVRLTKVCYVVRLVVSNFTLQLIISPQDYAVSLIVGKQSR